MYILLILLKYIITERWDVSIVMHDPDNNLVADFIARLDVDEYKMMFNQQIENEEEDYITAPVDHLTDLFNDYSKIMDLEDMLEDEREMIINNFTEICNCILLAINDKFDLDLDMEKVTSIGSNFVGITVALYRFFIIDFYQNVETIMMNYIEKHLHDLYDNFVGLSQKKDVVSSVNRKTLSEPMSVIASNLYDITDYIFSTMDSETALEYSDPAYTAGLVVGKLMKDDTISDEFVRTFADIYKNNVDLRSRVCFEILCAIKAETIRDIFKVNIDE